MKNSKVCIIGCGPAGIAAAIQLKRMGIVPTIFEKDKIGGLVENANLVENYPGFPNGIRGTELVRLLKSHLKNHGICPKFEEVESLKLSDKSRKEFFIKTNTGRIRTGIVIVASGTVPRVPSNINISEEAKKNIYYEVSPLARRKNKIIIVIGAGDAAFDYALNLSRNNNVTILNRTCKTKCLELLKKRARQIKSMSYLENILVKKIRRSNDKIEIMCSTKDRHSTRTINADFVILATGRKPNIGFLDENLKKNKRIYFAGDVKNKKLRQVAISVGDGVKIAMQISQSLERKT